MTHTPGPWNITGPSPGNQIRNMNDGGDYAIVQNGAIIAETFHRVKSKRYEDAEANARLIAAAPALLDALKATQDIARMVAFTSDVRLQLGPTTRAVDYFNKMFPEVAKAIALAEGFTPAEGRDGEP